MPPKFGVWVSMRRIFRLLRTFLSPEIPLLLRSLRFISLICTSSLSLSLLSGASSSATLHHRHLLHRLRLRPCFLLGDLTSSTSASFDHAFGFAVPASLIFMATPESVPEVTFCSLFHWLSFRHGCSSSSLLFSFLEPQAPNLDPFCPSS